MGGIDQIQAAGQSVWLATSSRPLLDDGTVDRYVREMAVSGARCRPAALDRAFRETSAYDDSLMFHLREGLRGEELFCEEALEDLTRAASLLFPVHRESARREGWVSLPVSPAVVHHPAVALEHAMTLHGKAGLPNLLIEIPATGIGLRAIEEAIVAGIPVLATLVFSEDQYLELADSWMRGLERRLRLGRNPHVPTVAAVDLEGWAQFEATPGAGDPGLASARLIVGAWKKTLEGRRFRDLEREGAEPHRLMWSLGDERRYLGRLTEADTILCVGDEAIRRFAEEAAPGATGPSEVGAGDGLDLERIAQALQRQGVARIEREYRELLRCIEEKTAALRASHVGALFGGGYSSSRSA